MSIIFLQVYKSIILSLYFSIYLCFCSSVSFYQPYNITSLSIELKSVSIYLSIYCIICTFLHSPSQLHELSFTIHSAIHQSIHKFIHYPTNLSILPSIYPTKQSILPSIYLINQSILSSIFLTNQSILLST